MARSKPWTRIRELNISREEVGAIIDREQVELARCEKLYRKGQPPLDLLADGHLDAA